MMRTKELTGAALDWAVAKCEFPELVWGETIGLSAHARDLIVIPERNEQDCWWCPSTKWAQGGAIIERDKIRVSPNVGGTWSAQIRHTESHPLVNRPVLAGWTNASGETPLIAAMRCYVASKLGDNVELPEGL